MGSKSISLLPVFTSRHAASISINNSSCIELAEMGASWIDDRVVGYRIMCFSVAFAYSCKQRLRDEPLCPKDLHGIVHAAEVRVYLSCGYIVSTICT